MSAAVGRWLANGWVGASSQALAAASLGALHNSPPNYPHDVDDFGRCVVLWVMAPEAKEGLRRLAEVSATWKRLADNWDELLRLYETDRSACDHLIRSLVHRVSGMYQTRKDADGRWDEFKVA